MSRGKTLCGTSSQSVNHLAIVRPSQGPAEPSPGWHLDLEAQVVLGPQRARDIVRLVRHVAGLLEQAPEDREVRLALDLLVHLRRAREKVALWRL